jgi:hypothetical protein
MGGFKLNVLVNNTYETTVEKISNAAYYPDLDNWAATQEFAGFGTFKNKNSGGGSFDFDVLAMLALEAGVKWRLNDEVFLYTGAYFDYGLNDPTKDVRTPISDYDYSNPEKNPPQIELLTVADRVNLMTIGIKLRLAFIRNSSPYDCPRGF